MPIYAYKCADCGHEKDVLQKVSDAPLTDCPACGAAAFTKQLTAAGFQLKGSGWYATDFKNGSKKPDTKTTDGTTADGKAADTKADGGKSDGAKSDGKSDATPADSKPAASPAPTAAG